MCTDNETHIHNTVTQHLILLKLEASVSTPGLMPSLCSNCSPFVQPRICTAYVCVCLYVGVCVEGHNSIAEKWDWCRGSFLARTNCFWERSKEDRCGMRDKRMQVCLCVSVCTTVCISVLTRQQHAYMFTLRKKGALISMCVCAPKRVCACLTTVCVYAAASLPVCGQCCMTVCGCIDPLLAAAV